MQQQSPIALQQIPTQPQVQQPPVEQPPVEKPSVQQPPFQHYPDANIYNIAYTPPTQVFSRFGSSPGVVLFVTIIAMLWILAGITAFIMSVVCFKFNGTGLQKFLGLILAILFGPFYWIYYGLSSTYCKTVKATNASRRR